jgi:multidrug efflux pump
MVFIPVTLIITLFASLIVAYIINPVFAIDFMKHDDEDKPASQKKIFKKTAWIVLVAVPFYLLQKFGIANLIVFVAFHTCLHNLWGYKVFRRFQKEILPSMMQKYENLCLSGH